MMRKPVILFSAAALAGGISSPARGDSEIVVATRYLQAKGVSHSHLYLYRVDGRLLRQLTHDNTGQDMNPVFAPDGETIVFTRDKGAKGKEYWSIEPRGTGLKRLAAPPEWYSNTKSSPYFMIEYDPGKAGSAGISGAVGKEAPHVKAPDGSVELVLELTPEEANIDMEGVGEKYLLKDLRAGTQTEFGKLPGFRGLRDMLQLPGSPPKSFLLEGRLRAAFFELHLNSTDGTTVYALDLPRKRLVQLSPNWATPFPLPGELAFLTLTQNRYVPIPNSKKTANSSYVERWDARFRKVRYGRSTAAINYGASMYRPGKKPAVVTIRQDPR